MGAPPRAALGPTLGARGGAAASTNGAPQVAQNRVAVGTGDPQRAQRGPEPGADSRRPQCGQNGSGPLVAAPQNGQLPAPAGGVAATGGVATRVLATGAAPPPDPGVSDFAD